VKKVLIGDRRTFEVWYRLPQFPGVRMPGNLVAPTSQYAKQTKPLRIDRIPNVVFHFHLPTSSIERGKMAKDDSMSISRIGLDQKTNSLSDKQISRYQNFREIDKTLEEIIIIRQKVG
jgi:hypothetical protein